MKLAILCAVLIGGVLVGIQATTNSAAADQSEQLSGSVITPDNLKSALEGLGFEPKDLGSNTYQIEVESQFKVFMSLSFSKDQSKLWMSVFFGELDDPARFSSERLTKMLQSNFKTGTSFFCLDEKKLKMSRPVDSRGLTRALVRKEIEAHARNVAQTESLWNKKTSSSN